MSWFNIHPWHSPQFLSVTVLLQAVADKIIPGISQNMRILLVTQIVDTDSTAMDLTITQAVVKSDLRREVAVEEYNSMSPSIN